MELIIDLILEFKSCPLYAWRTSLFTNTKRVVLWPWSHKMVKRCSEGILVWSSCFSLVEDIAGTEETFPKIENRSWEQPFSSLHSGLWMSWTFPHPAPPLPGLQLPACCLNVSSTGVAEYLMGISRMAGFTLSQQDLTHANSPRLRIAPCYFDLGHK